MRTLRVSPPEHVAVVPVLMLAASAAFVALVDATGIVGATGRDLLRGWGSLALAAALVAMTLAQCARRRYPVGSFLATVAVTASLVAVVDDLGFTPLYWMAIVGLGIRVSGALLASTVTAGIAVDIAVSVSTSSAWVVSAVNIAISYAVLLALGKVIARNRSHAIASTVAQREHDLRLEEAIEGERRTMARELHDVAAHHLTAMIISAKAADKVMATDPQHAQELLGGVITSGQRTLDGLRQIVGILRYSSEEDAPPQPMIDDIADLVEESEHALRRVRIEITDDVENVDSAVQLTCYRIAQESLANAMRHAPGSDAAVRLARRNGSLHLSITDTGHDGPAALDGQGLGIAGMRERAALLGGRLDAGPSEGGGWHVTAQLPIDGRIAP